MDCFAVFYITHFFQDCTTSLSGIHDTLFQWGGWILILGRMAFRNRRGDGLRTIHIYSSSLLFWGAACWHAFQDIKLFLDIQKGIWWHPRCLVIIVWASPFHCFIQQIVCSSPVIRNSMHGTNMANPSKNGKKDNTEQEIYQRCHIHLWGPSSYIFLLTFILTIFIYSFNCM